LAALENYLDVYLDVLLMENLVINYLILWVTGKFARIKSMSLRLFLGSLAGAAYVVLLVMFPDIGFYYSIPAKLLLSLLIVAIAFAPVNIGSFIKTLIIFYMVTFVFAGASFASLYLNNTGGFVRNGIIYVFWTSKWATVALAILTAIIVLRVFWEIAQYKLAKARLLRTVGISFDDRKADFSALVDTGNSLHDPVTNLPVVVVEFAAIKNILPKEICSIFTEGKEDDLSTVASLVTNSSWYSRFRLIPFTSLGKENGILIGFKPDYIEIDGEDDTKRGIKDVIVGIYNKTLSRNRSYQALLSPDLL
jgi:stage II sporulation protein GA (sporulation sigma-E factor processing peptidase)